MPTATKGPVRGVAAVMGTFVGGLGLASLAARAFDRNPACQTPLDFVVLSNASFKAARTLARDEVTSLIREPFVEARRTRAARSRSRRATPARRSASSSPLTWSLAAAGVNDWLQAGFAAITSKANELEQRSSRQPA